MKPLFTDRKTLNNKAKLLDLSQPRIMGILNITPDSFYLPGDMKMIEEGSLQEEKIITRVGKMVDEGVDIVDVGGVSTRPGAGLLDRVTEEKRVLPVIKTLHKNFPELTISIDTFRAEIARKAVASGASMVNDVSGGQFDETMFNTVAELGVPYILMHMQGKPENMQESPTYEDVVLDIVDYFLERIEVLKDKGVKDVIIDPGFGFGKTLEHNFKLLQKLDYFKTLELPILVGISRKSMVNKVLGTKPASALNGTTILNTLALQKGADLLRVHDVREAKEVIKLVNYYNATV